MNTDSESDRNAAEAWFAEIYAHRGFITGYARHRGARDPDGIAAEAMAIAWRRLADVPTDDPRPWLIVTARNLLLSERRREPLLTTQPLGDFDVEAPVEEPALELGLDPELARGLSALPEKDREALLLIAWDDLTPALAAKSLGISQTAFRMRLLRARRRLSDLLGTQFAAAQRTSPIQQPNVPARQPNWR